MVKIKGKWKTNGIIKSDVCGQCVDTMMYTNVDDYKG